MEVEEKGERQNLINGSQSLLFERHWSKYHGRLVLLNA